MKINAHNLRDALKLVSPAIQKNPLTPIFEGVKIEDNFLHASSMDISVCVPLAMPLGMPPMVLEYATLKAAIEKLDSDELDMTSNETGIVLKSGRARVTVPTVGKPEEWPTITKDNNAPTCELTRVQVDKVAGLIPFTIQNDIARPSLAGICFNGLEFVATNGHILALLKVAGLSRCKEIILPVKLFYVLSAFAYADAYVFDKGTVTVKKAGADLATVRFRTVDERYPSYQNIIPDYRNHPHVAFEREEMSDAIDVLTIGANATTNSATFEIGKAGGMVASSQDIDRNRDAAVNITTANTGFNEPMRIGINTKFLSTTLKYLGGEEAVLYTNDYRRAMIFTCEDKDKMALVMPLIPDFAD